MTSKALLFRGVGDEFAAAVLNDERLNRRLDSIVERIAVGPGLSFPKLLKGPGELEALYRLFRNEDVEWSQIAEPHIVGTAARCGHQGLVRVVHDTTDFVFSGQREGLGTVLQNTKGFFLHAGIAVSGDDSRTPLGLLGSIPYVRPKGSRKAKSLNERKRNAREAPRSEKESSRWELLARDIAARLPTREAIHVMDQEADDYALMAALKADGLRFVIRGSRDRLTSGNHGPNVEDALKKEATEIFREVPLSERPSARSRSSKKKSHPPRAMRVAKLDVRWTSIELNKPQHAQTDVQSLQLNVVQVFEPAPPAGEEPVTWTLFTTEPVTTLEEATAIVDHYRARWRIEEFFKALKTGCKLQERQLTTLAALLKAMAIFFPFAWQLLLLRSLGREENSVPANLVFDTEEIEALAFLAHHEARHQMPKRPTMRDAMNAVAALGGHIKNNGAPGWLVLGRGYEDFLRGLDLWRAIRGAKM